MTDEAVKGWLSGRGAAGRLLSADGEGLVYEVAIGSHRDNLTVMKATSSRYSYTSRATLLSEYEALSAFHEALAGTAGVAAPEPIEFVPELPAYVMRHVDGDHLDRHLGRVLLSDNQARELANRLITGLLVFHNTVAAPYGDFHPRNVIVSAEGVLHLIDPTMADPFFSSPVKGRSFAFAELDLGYWLYSVLVREVRRLPGAPKVGLRRLRFTAMLMAVAERQLGAAVFVGAERVCAAHASRLTRNEPLKGRTLALGMHPLKMILGQMRKRLACGAKGVA